MNDSLNAHRHSKHLSGSQAEGLSQGTQGAGRARGEKPHKVNRARPSDSSKHFLPQQETHSSSFLTDTNTVTYFLDRCLTTGFERT